ncbi:hypothetical protein PV05_12017 [Exophiala xenobiotica]|uniref:Haloacid dehalogenase, type II n=1 Tax=Exophiala xenobiotica TaxID=348802 RepID=A0A0D2E6R3_9EURO|nr:uncharacterized protein PV05_12017 [Exophiala xenobiotica]KIW50430.1 hypothetical protein PV05_12017 [Exophiala xenobiotica]
MPLFQAGQPFRNFLRAMTNPTRVPVFVVSLDALGTLYRFREPVSNQYIKIAQNCGLKSHVDPTQLNKSFKEAFKHYNLVYPNYGKSKLENPEKWWTKVVNRAFGELVDKDEIPSNLGVQLYHHFSSGAAYELYPDVRPFLDHLGALKREFNDPDGPLVVTGVITNSDPRVSLVLMDLGLRVGLSETPTINMGKELSESWANVKAGRYDAELDSSRKYFKPDSDIDFLTTSYEVGVEKPDAAMWDMGRRLLNLLPLFRATSTSRPSSPSNPAEYADLMARSLGYRVGEVMWLHIGDEYEKDYVGATQASVEALLLQRENDDGMLHKGPMLEKGVPTISTLSEAAMVINVKARQFFQQIDS